MAKRRRVVAPERKPPESKRFFRRPAAEIPDVPVVVAAVKAPESFLSDEYVKAVVGEKLWADAIRYDTVFEAEDRGTKILFLADYSDGKKILRVEISTQGHILFKTLEIPQAISLANKLEWYLREEEP
jgi:hypothetical protein